VQHPDLCSSGAAAVSRRDKFRLASVAVMAAGAVAVVPATQGAVEIQQVQTRAYELTASMEATASPAVVYGALFNNTFTNLSALGSAIAANPAPLLNQLLENQQGYTDQIGAAFASIPTTLQTWYNGPNGQVRLAQAQAALEAGDIGEAYRWFNHSMLYAFQGAFGPLIAPGLFLSGTPRGGTEYLAGIPEQMAQNFTNLVATTFTSSVLVSAVFQGVFATVSGPLFELSRVAESLGTSIASGDVQGAVNALVNTPAILVNAALNGFDYADDDPTTPEVEGYTQWPALLHFAVPGPAGSPRVVQGLLQQLLVTIPANLAKAIDNTPEVVVPPTTAAALAATVTEKSVTTEKAVEAPKVEAVSADVVEGAKVETPAAAAETSVGVAETVAAEAAAAAEGDAATAGKTKIKDRIAAKINEAKDARAKAKDARAKAKEAKATKAKEAKATKAKDAEAKDAKGSNADGAKADAAKTADSSSSESK
jgi:hypothetical protein